MAEGCAAILASLLALSGCVTQDVVQTMFADQPCIADAAQRVAAADWEKAETIDIKVRQGEFQPMVIRLRQDRPYVLRITNRDDVSRVFRASEFFASVALAKVALGETEATPSCLSAVAVPPREIVSVHLVAVRDGRYSFEDTVFFILPILPGRGHGVISIQ